MRAWVGAFAVAVVALATGCPPPQLESKEPTAEPHLSQRAIAQRESLATVWYRGNPLPPRPSKAEARAARKLVLGAASHERELLEKLYPDDAEMWALAIRDSDGDGIKDYRISDYLGKFLEGDTDLDGDGVDNYADRDPFDPSSAREQRGVPPWLDWSNDRDMSPQMAAIQKQVLADHGVLLVERSARFNDSLARAVQDTLPILLRETPRGLPTLRTIATERSSLLDPEHPDGLGDFAQVFAASSSLVVYQLGIDAKPVIQLGLLVHEISHSIQAAMDHSVVELARGEQKRSRRFLALMKRFGWTFSFATGEVAQRFRLFRPHYVGAAPFVARWQGRTHEEWLAELDDLSLASDEARAQHIIGAYALSTPSEWYADHLISYVFIALIDSVRAHCTRAGWLELVESFGELVTDAWPEYAYANARGSPFQKELATRFPLDAPTRARLARRYLAPARFCAPTP